jgi:hypothetical protein
MALLKDVIQSSSFNIKPIARLISSSSSTVQIFLIPNLPLLRAPRSPAHRFEFPIEASNLIHNRNVSRAPCGVRGQYRNPSVGRHAEVSLFFDAPIHTDAFARELK